MAENPSPSASSSTNKAGIFAKARKFSSRTKAKVLQNLGKAERTQDEVFTDNCLKIEKQQEVATHLQKELKKYMHCVRDLFTASKSFHAALSSTYEDEWTEQENFNSQVQTFELLWNDYLQSLQDKVAAPMGTYLQSFPILKNKVTKRNRKMVDFDNSRHNLEVLQAAKKKDELKIQRATEELSSAKQIYEGINNDLHSELPEFYNSRVTFYADLFSSLFGSEYVFHSEQGKSNGNLGDVCQKLGKDFEQYAYKPKRPISKSISTNSVGEHVNGDSSPAGASPTKEEAQPVYVNAGEKKAILEEDSPAENGNDRASSPEDDQEPGSPPRAAPRISMPLENGESKDDSSDDEDNEDDEEVKNIATTAAVRGDSVTEETKVEALTPAAPRDEEDDDDKAENLYSTPPASDKLKVDPPEGMLFLAQATHKYGGEDVDELTFEPGEVIFVMPFDNPDEQDDGWLFGIKASDGLKGVFPENFTRRL